MTIKRIERNCDLFEKVCVAEVKTETDTITKIKTVIEYRDTTIYIKIPGKTVIKEVPVYIENGIVNSLPLYLSVPFAESYAQVVNSELISELTQTDTILRIRLENSLKREKILETEIIRLKEKKVVLVKENSNWAKLCIKIVWGLFVVIILVLGWLVLKYKTKLVGLAKKLF